MLALAAVLGVGTVALAEQPGAGVPGAGPSPSDRSGVPTASAPPVPADLPPEYLVEQVSGFRFVYHPSVRDRLRPLFTDAPLARAELSSLLGRPVLTGVEVRVAVNRVDLDRVLTSGATEGKDASIDAARATVALCLAADADGARALLRSALAELALHEAAGDRVARWFRIGFVGRFAEPSSFARRRAFWHAAMVEVRPSLAELDARLRLEVRAGDWPEAAAVELVAQLAGSPDAFQRLVTRLHAGTAFEPALLEVHALDASALELRLASELRRQRAALGLGLAVLAIWGAVFATHVVRVRRRARAEEEARARAALVPVVRVATMPSRRRRQERPDPVEPTDSEVPRVAHDGGWHTLH
ncbi:MAG: hypothetical protein FJ096_15615 [Deltaproteobacteria bacterium]|nr:hypothetical protein [Deltaproteobacteria bacterium]